MLEKSKTYYMNFQEPLDAYQVAALENNYPVHKSNHMFIATVEAAARLMKDDGWVFCGYNEYGLEVYRPKE